MGGACGTYGGEVNCVQSFGGETWGKGVLGIDERILLKLGLQEIGLWNVDWTYVAPYRDTWRNVVSAAMNAQVS